MQDSAWLGAAALVAHPPALFGGFVVDDRMLLIENPYVRTFSGLGVLLRHELFAATAEPRVVPYYRPISALVNGLTFQLFGASPVFQHGFNIVLHAFVTLAVYGVRRRYSTSRADARTLALVVDPESLLVLRPFARSRLGLERARRAFLVSLLASGQLDVAARTRAPVEAAKNVTP